MPKLPQISGDQLIRALELSGYSIVRTKGIHVRMYPPRDRANAKKVTVPLHKVIKRGTLNAILKDTGLSVEDLSA